MTMLRLTTHDDDRDHEPLRFPVEQVRSRSREAGAAPQRYAGPMGSPADVLSALSNVSRRMDDLARELDVLGHYSDDDDDRPRAA